MKISFYILFITFSFINLLSANENSYYLILKNNEVNVRYEPDLNSPIKYIYKKAWIELTFKLSDDVSANLSTKPNKTNVLAKVHLIRNSI